MYIAKFCIFTSIVEDVFAHYFYLFFLTVKFPARINNVGYYTILIILLYYGLWLHSGWQHFHNRAGNNSTFPPLGPSHHDVLPADLRTVPDQTEKAHRQDDSHRAAVRGRVPLRQLSPHHQLVNTTVTAQTPLLYSCLLQHCSDVLFFLCSEEIAFYNGNMREKQTIHSAFKKLVGNSLTVRLHKQTC